MWFVVVVEGQNDAQGKKQGVKGSQNYSKINFDNISRFLSFKIFAGHFSYVVTWPSLPAFILFRPFGHVDNHVTNY